jgi:quercetin dioxygenase-like cupin family protein
VTETTGQKRSSAVIYREPLVAGFAHPSQRMEMRGAVTGRVLRAPDSDLWAVEVVLGEATELRWRTGSDAEAIYVLSGSLRAGDDVLRADSALIIEPGAETVAVAEERTHLIQFGGADASNRPGPLGAPSPDDHKVHVVHRADCPSLSATGTLYYADSNCPTCRVTLLRNYRHVAHRSPSHIHSADELIYVLSGDVRLGSQVLESGMAVAIPGGQRYAFRSEDGFDFLNFRAEASLYTGQPGEPPVLEVLAHLQ